MESLRKEFEGLEGPSFYEQINSIFLLLLAIAAGISSFVMLYLPQLLKVFKDFKFLKVERFITNYSIEYRK